MRNSILHKAESRGVANHGWLNSRHTFSFGSYYDAERMNFGALRVLNDDIVAPGMGFGKHPHKNMEIISIPIEGDLEHRDSMGNIAIIKEGDVQVMSAGEGITHSEHNKNKDREVKFLQIWVIPNKLDVKPRYDQISLNEIQVKNEFYQVISPNPEDQGLWIHQNAWFHLGNFEKDIHHTYQVKNEVNGIYVFVIDGTIEINGQILNQRDGLGVWNTTQENIYSIEKSKVLIMEVPIKIE